MKHRILNALRIFIWAFKNPYAIKDHNLKMLSDLLVMILKVQEENRHIMTHIAFVHPEEGEKQIVSILAGAGIGSSPTKRISELLEENAKLKSELAKTIV